MHLDEGENSTYDEAAGPEPQADGILYLKVWMESYLGPEVSYNPPALSKICGPLGKAVGCT